MLRRVLFGTLHKFADVGIPARLKLVLYPLKNQTPFPHYHEDRCLATVTDRIEPATSRIVPEVSDQVPVLIAMGHDERGRIVGIALLVKGGMVVWGGVGTGPAVGES